MASPRHVTAGLYLCLESLTNGNEIGDTVVAEYRVISRSNISYDVERRSSAKQLITKTRHIKEGETLNKQDASGKGDLRSNVLTLLRLRLQSSTQQAGRGEKHIAWAVLHTHCDLRDLIELWFH